MTTHTVRPCPACAFVHGTHNGCPPADLVTRARTYIAIGDWTFASTMPDNPHWYTVRQRAWAESPEVGEGHEALWQLIRWFYYLRWWHGRGYRSIDLDDFSYWVMNDGTVINRKPVDDAGWDGA